MKKLAVLFLIACAAGCSDSADNKGPQGGTEPPDGAIFSKSLVQTFVIPTEVAANIPSQKNNYIELEFRGTTVSNAAQAGKAEYTLLCEKFNDLAYNGKIVPFSTQSVSEVISAIDVVCDKSIDTDHPAGAPLNDIIKICAVSYKSFIENKYTQPANHSFPAEFDGLYLYRGIGSGPVFKPLDELGEEDLELAEPKMCLYFPEKLGAGPYLFTITVTTESGTLTQTVEYGK